MLSPGSAGARSLCVFEMMTLEELVHEDPFINVMKEWIAAAKNQVTVLEPSSDCGGILLNVQVTTRSILGTLIYHTGGILIDHGWLRVLGSGNKELLRDAHSWNSGSNGTGIYLIADDAAGGFYAINGGAFSGEKNSVYYLAPDSMNWEGLDLKFSDFFSWLLSGNLDEFYEGLRWDTWKEDVKTISADQCMAFYPPLWSEQGDCSKSYRGVVSISEALGLKFEFQTSQQENT